MADNKDPQSIQSIADSMAKSLAAVAAKSLDKRLSDLAHSLGYANEFMNAPQQNPAFFRNNPALAYPPTHYNSRSGEGYSNARPRDVPKDNTLGWDPSATIPPQDRLAIARDIRADWPRQDTGVFAIDDSRAASLDVRRGFRRLFHNVCWYLEDPEFHRLRSSDPDPSNRTLPCPDLVVSIPALPRDIPLNSNGIPCLDIQARALLDWAKAVNKRAAASLRSFLNGLKVEDYGVLTFHFYESRYFERDKSVCRQLVGYRCFISGISANDPARREIQYLKLIVAVLTQPEVVKDNGPRRRRALVRLIETHERRDQRRREERERARGNNRSVEGGQPGPSLDDATGAEPG